MQLHNISDYTDERFNILDLVEGDKLYAYPDSKGIPTIGIGLNLQTHGALVLQILGFDFSGKYLKGTALTKERYYIDKFLVKQTGGLFYKPYPSKNTVPNQALTAFNAMLHLRAIDPVYANPQNFVSLDAYNEFHATQSMFFETFYIPSVTYPSTNTTASEYLFTQVVDGYINPDTNKAVKGYEERLDDWLNISGISVAQPGLKNHDNKERIVLLSLAYNSETYTNDLTGTTWNDKGYPKLLGPNLANALKSGDRLRAWFEIRYKSNSDKINANRRYHESDYFGLWDGTSPTQTELDSFNDFLNQNDPYGSNVSVLQLIRNYEADYDPHKRTEFHCQNIDEIINNPDVKAYFVAKYGRGQTIDGKVILGTELNNTVIDSTRILSNAEIKGGYLESTSLGDLILGGKGRDIIDGGVGNDVIYANDDNDDLNGGEGEDLLIGSDRKDVLLGGEVDDLISGGKIKLRRAA